MSRKCGSSKGKASVAGLSLLFILALAPVSQSAAAEEHPGLDIAIHAVAPNIARRSSHIESDVRIAEARIVAVQLMESLSRSQTWSRVRIVPDEFHPLHLTLTPRIIELDSNLLHMEIEVVDASGKRWLSRKYREYADPCAYESSETDPFHVLYDRVADDVHALRTKLPAKTIERLRAIARLRFAAELAPLAFSGHVVTTRRGQMLLRRLPAENDTLLSRIELIRKRHLQTLDVFTDHYSRFREDVQEPYDFYRSASYEVQRELDTLAWVANLHRLEYGVPMLLFPSLHGRCSRLGLGPLIPKPISPSDLYDEMRSLTEQFNSEIEPTHRAVHDRTAGLQESLEAQYAIWRTLVQRMAAAEVGVARPDVEP